VICRLCALSLSLAVDPQLSDACFLGADPTVQVVTGWTAVDESMVTGESMPVSNPAQLIPTPNLCLAPSIHQIDFRLLRDYRVQSRAE
jgi:hypothetical protein